MTARLRALAILALAGCPAPRVVMPRARPYVPPLPEPISNNAVAAVERDGKCTIVSALGLRAPRADAIVSHSYDWSPGERRWRPLPDVPGPARIAASAVALRGDVFVLGGYDVAADRHETSHAEMGRLDVVHSRWTEAPPLPIAIDDAVAVAWRDRWLVVVSGWSNDAPISKVQIFDLERGIWAEATPFPGIPVFGHTAALHDDELIVLDGVTKAAHGYAIVAQAWSGTLDPARPETITWRDLGAHPGPPRYRAAAGRAASGDLVFAGGTADPYNFDGVSYRRRAPSEPEASLLVWQAASRRFVLRPSSGLATMDHRALARCGDALYVVGGMIAGPRVVPDVSILDE